MENENIYDKRVKYINILNRIQKKISVKEGLFIIIRLYLTNNIFYYILCILFRFIALFIISGEYNTIFNKNSLSNNSYRTIGQFIRLFTLHNLITKFQLSDTVYICISLLIFALFLIRIIIYFSIINSLKNYKYTNKWPIPRKYYIIIDHIIFLFFPYIIEFLSFSYYIYFFPKKFIIKLNNNNMILIIVIILNTILIIVSNLNNYIFIKCSNKEYTINQYEAFSGLKKTVFLNRNKCVSFKLSSLSFCILIILQNFIPFQALENYINNYYIIYYKISISIILFFIILLLLYERINVFNYNNFINNFINICIIYCFYSIIIDFLLFLYRYKTKNLLKEILYIIVKIILSYITHEIILLKGNKFLENSIREILFKEKIIKNKQKYADALIYLNELMTKLPEENNFNNNINLINFLNVHIKKCKKVDCNCNLLNLFLNNNNSMSNENEDNTISNLISILNYLYESIFIEYDYYNKYDLSILLAEHFCNLRDNPIMAFSLVMSLIIRQRNNFPMFQMVTLYELCQKYIYYASSKDKLDIKFGNNNRLINIERYEYFQNYFTNLKTSYKIKNIFNYYINILLKILKYQNIFGESLSFQLDENNEYIKNVKIDFFDINFEDSNFNDNNSKNKNQSNKGNINNHYFNFVNLNKIITQLKKEKFYFQQIINSIERINIKNHLPSFMIYKYYLFFDIIDGGNIPEQILFKINSLCYFKNNLYNCNISKDLYISLNNKYIEENYKINSKYFAIFEFKRDIKIKYFSEICSLKLGYNQNDLINENIDELMPKDFCKSHQYLIKKLFLGEQLKCYNLNNNCLFDKSSTVLFSVQNNGILIYNLSKCLVVVSEIEFNTENDYKFMLNQNFEIIAISKNFENNYLLNQKIFQIYDLKLMDILNIKPEILNKKLTKDFNLITKQNSIRTAKPEEYFIPQLYKPKEDKNASFIHSKIFNIKKSKILSKLLNSKNSDDNFKNNNNNKDDFEDEKLINNEILKKDILNLIQKPGQIIIHKKINFVLNKMKFIENMSKQLFGISDNKINEKNEKEHNLAKNSKKLVYELLSKKELSKEKLIIEFKLSFYYDKPFYFITIQEENKFLIQNIYNKINKQKIPIPPQKNNLKKINLNKKIKKNSRNSCFNGFIKKGELNNLVKNEINIKNKDEKENRIIEEEKQIEKEKIIMEKIKKFEYEINNNKFTLIKALLFFFILFSFIIYIIIIIQRIKLISITEKFLLSCFYNYRTRDVIVSMYSKLIALYHELSGVSILNKANESQKAILGFSQTLREKYHSFNIYFNIYNLEIGNHVNIIYEQKKYLKLREKWKEIPYISTFASELDLIIYTISLINATNTNELESDVKNFLFYEGNLNRKDKVNTAFIKLVFYIGINYENTYKEIFSDINSELYSSYKRYNSKSIILYYILELGGIFLNLLFFVIILFYLYYSNLIIIKNIIFLFLDLTEEDFSKIKNNNASIILKLLEFQKLMNDFDLKRLKKYSIDLENINTKIDRQKFTIINNKENNKIISDEGKENRDENSTNKNLVNICISSISKYETKKRKSNNSSYNYLANSNSNLIREKLNNNSINSKGEISLENLSTKKIISNSNNNQKKQMNILFQNNNSDCNGNNNYNLKENYQEAVLNKSNKSFIPTIKVYLIIILIFIIVIIFYTAIKITNNYNLNNQCYRFYTDFSIITERYYIIYYYFNVFKTIIVINSNDLRWKIMLKTMENMNKEFEKLNKDYLEVLSHSEINYKKVKKLIEIINYNKNDANILIKENICGNNALCAKYLESPDCVFNSGIDNVYKSIINNLGNIFNDYKNLKNYNNLNELISSISSTERYDMMYIRESFRYVFYDLKEQIFEDFESDEIYFRNKYRNNIFLLNIISIIFSVIILFFTLFIFISISNISNPLKDSIYRIVPSFYYIKNYRFNKY